MALDNDTLRERARGYTRRPVASVTTRTRAVTSSVPIVLKHTAVVTKSLKTPMIDGFTVPSRTTTKPDKPIHQQNHILPTQTVTTPTKRTIQPRIFHRRTLKNIPTFPIPSRKGILGITDSTKRTVIKAKKPAIVIAILIALTGAGYYMQNLLQEQKESADTIAYNKAVTAASDPDAPDAYIETQPTVGLISAHQVAATIPRTISIQKLGTFTTIKQVNKSSSDQIANPQNIYEVGWYEASARPGEPGTVVLIGNVAGPTKNGVFYKLKDLTIGDSVAIERGDNQLIRYKVNQIKNIVYGLDVSNTLLGSADNQKENLAIITGAGAFNSASQSYPNRLVVYATRDN